MKKIMFVLVAILLLAGCGKKVDIDGEKISYEELQRSIEEKQKELDDISKDLNENKEYYDELQQIENEREELMQAALEYKGEIVSLETEIEEKQDELNKINGEIAKVIDEPIKVNPGTFYFGDDIEEGRYKVTNQDGQRGNIYFRGGEGFAETFGKGEYSIEEYTFNAYDGEEIQFDIPALLYPVE